MKRRSGLHLGEAPARLRRTQASPLPILLATLLFLASCASTSQLTTNRFEPVPDPRLVVMPLDIEIQEFTAGGLELANAAWTQQARAEVTAAVRAHLENRTVSTVLYGRSPGGGAAAAVSTAAQEIAPEHVQLQKVHEAIGATILLSTLVPDFRLPTKKGRFDWTLGPGAVALGRRVGADYALFMFIRDSFSTAGRKAIMVLAAAFGVGIPLGSQRAFASLVDLRTGDIVWFNHLFSKSGDMREPDGAREAVETLLDGFPVGASEDS